MIIVNTCKSKDIFELSLFLIRVRRYRNMVKAIQEMMAKAGDDPEVEVRDDLASACRAIRFLSRNNAISILYMYLIQCCCVAGCSQELLM